MTIAPGTQVGRYSIVETIGAGGMGEVYRARDCRLQRDVALKVLSDDLIRDPASVVRFEQEAIAASALNHPHILQIYDTGQYAVDARSVSVIVMELVEGHTLRQRLSESSDRRLLLRIMIQVGDALARAHAAGIVHRDLKPENIMITDDGYAKILDFGLAKLTRPDRGGAESDATAVRTSAGVVIGTPAYMSPEQAGGQTADARSDIFSFGAVLYEVLTGRRSFVGASAIDILHSVLHDQPPLDSLGPFRAVVSRCLAKEPHDRYASMSDVIADLRPLADVPSGAAKVRKSTPQRSSRAKLVDSLVVLPFENTSGDPESEYLSDGIAETLISGLAMLPNLRVVPRSTAFRLRGREDLAAVAAELHVRAVLTGRVSHRGDRILVSAELLDTATDSQLWGDQYSRPLIDLVDVQKSVAADIAAQLRPALSGRRKKLVTRIHTDDPHAYQLYLKGRFHLYRRVEGSLRKSMQFFQQAIETDPTYTRGYAGLADAWLLLGWYSLVRPREAFPKALAAARQALEIDDSFAEAHTSLGYALMLGEWDFGEAEREFQRAIALDPAYPLAHHWYADLLQTSGRAIEAIAEASTACRLDPLALILNAELGRAHYYAGHFDEAIEQQQKTLDLEPGFAPSLFFVSQAYERTGRLAEAAASLEKALAAGENPAFTGFLGCVLARSGRTSDAETILETLLRGASGGWLPAFPVALVHLGLGATAEATKWLDTALAERSHWLLYANVDPLFEEWWKSDDLSSVRNAIERLIKR